MTRASHRMKTAACPPAQSGGRAAGGRRIPTRPATLNFISGSSPQPSPRWGVKTGDIVDRCAPEPATVRSAGLQPAWRVHFGQTARKQPPYTTSGSGKPVTDRRSGKQCRDAGAGEGGSFMAWHQIGKDLICSAGNRPQPICKQTKQKYDQPHKKRPANFGGWTDCHHFGRMRRYARHQ